MNPCMCGCGGAARNQFIRGHNVRLRKYAPLEERYVVSERGYSSPCWIYTGVIADTGYGHLMVNGQIVCAHRVYYERYVGPIPPGLHIDHLCRQPACVNPDHLEPVTLAENSRRGRNAKLTHATAGAIRASTEPTRLLAKRYGVSRATIKSVRAGDTWQIRAAGEAAK